MGTSTFANYTVLPEIAVAKIREDAPFDKVCYIGCGVTTGIGAVINTAKVEQGAKAIVFGLGGIGLNVLQGLRLAGADMIIGVDINNDRKAWGERFGMTHFVNPKELGKDLVPHLVDMTKSGADQIGGADYTFDCTGNVTVMRQALEACHRGWGQSIVIGVAPAGAEISTRPFQLVTGRVWKGTAFGGARGRTDVPKIVDWYMQGKIQIDPMITHVMPLTEINNAFELMKRGEFDPRRGDVLRGSAPCGPRNGQPNDGDSSPRQIDRFEPPTDATIRCSSTFERRIGIQHGSSRYRPVPHAARPDDTDGNSLGRTDANRPSEPFGES